MTRQPITSCEIHRDTQVWVVTAETKRGEVFYHPHVFKSEETANRFSRKVREKGSIDMDIWNFFRNAYGSEAWEAEENEAFMWKLSLMLGTSRESDAPDAIRALL